MKLTHAIIGLATFTTIAIVSCKKKDPVAMATPCAAVIYGYNGIADTASLGPFGAHSFGIFNPSTAGSSVITSVYASTSPNQGAYNTSDNCYYTFTYNTYFFPLHRVSKLYKITPSGTVITYTLSSSDSTSLTNIVYNSTTNKLNCIKGGSPDTLVELAFGSGTIFTYTALTSIPSTTSTYSHMNSMTIDQSTGTVFCALSSGPYPGTYTIGKVSAGGSFSTITTGANAYFYDLKYNSADNMLYCVRENNSTTIPVTYNLVKIDPASGVITNLSTLPIHYNDDFHTACLDACNGKYILSTMLFNTTTSGFVMDSSSVLQLSTSTGALIQQNTVQGIYQGLDIKY